MEPDKSLKIVRLDLGKLTSAFTKSSGGLFKDQLTKAEVTANFPLWEFGRAVVMPQVINACFHRGIQTPDPSVLDLGIDQAVERSGRPYIDGSRARCASKVASKVGRLRAFSKFVPKVVHHLTNLDSVGIVLLAVLPKHLVGLVSKHPALGGVDPFGQLSWRQPIARSGLQFFHRRDKVDDYLFWDGVFAFQILVVYDVIPLVIGLVDLVGPVGGLLGAKQINRFGFKLRDAVSILAPSLFVDQAKLFVDLRKDIVVLALREHRQSLFRLFEVLFDRSTSGGGALTFGEHTIYGSIDGVTITNHIAVPS